MNVREKILEFVNKKSGIIKTADIVSRLHISRQHASGILAEFVSSGKLMKIGSTKNAQYILPEYATKHPEIFPARFAKTFLNKDLQEHKVLDEIEARFPSALKLNENLKSVLTYTFSEMLNNAIEHSGSKKISVEVSMEKQQFRFIVDDFGVGAFRHIMQKKHLKSELEAIQDLLKGKTTTMPKSHSGEGIFFTSKIGDEFILDSYGYRLIVNNKINDIFLEELKGRGKRKNGTKVTFTISTDSKIHLNDVFQRYVDADKQGNYGFDKTEINVKLYTIGGVHISRSQARRILTGLEKFRIIIFDFDKVPVIGQAFADEIFRVFHRKHPNISLKAINMNKAVKFMVERVENIVRINK